MQQSGALCMPGAPTAIRDGHVLLEPSAKKPANNSEDQRASFHLVGSHLLRIARASGRREACAAAVEVFRTATETYPEDPSLRNGAGVSLLAHARYQSLAPALDSLARAEQEFRAASMAAKLQGAPRATIQRYSINLATVQWIYGERRGDHQLIEQAVETLQLLAEQLSPSSPYRPHVLDNLGNALMALGRTVAAIRAFQVALGSKQAPEERGRTLNNLGTAYAERGRHMTASKCFQEALLLQPRDRFPLAWGLSQHNLAGALLQLVLSSRHPEREDKRLGAAIDAYEAASEVRRRDQTPLDWSVTSVNLAGALVARGVHLCADKRPSEGAAGIRDIRKAISLYFEALPELGHSETRKTVDNIVIALQVLDRLSDDHHTKAEISARRAYILSLTAGHDIQPGSHLIHELASKSPAGSPAPPRHREWPAETFREARKERKENIVEFLTRVWLPFIQAGLIDLRSLRAHDPSAAKAIDNYQQGRDPTTGQRRTLPSHVKVPTLREVNDRLAASIPVPGDRPARLDWALRARARRQRVQE